MGIAKDSVDYSLYLVTDSSLLCPSAKSFEDQVAQLIDGGVTIVQLREKSLSTADFVKRGQKLLELTRSKKIPLIINDRVDVALAIDADGVHVGQDDMELTTARELLGKDKIIGVSVNTIQEAETALRDGADYLGIGAIFDTSTKRLTSPPCGINGLREILKVVSSKNPRVKTVAIGGLNGDNVGRIRYQSETVFPKAKLDGVAAVSALMSATDPRKAAADLKEAFTQIPVFIKEQGWTPERDINILSIKDEVARIVKAVQNETPLVHHLTNNVVKNFSANITLAIGASPIMSEAPLDFPPLANLPSPHSCVLNLGTLTQDLFQAYGTALFEYNKAGWPIILDPVGAGATKFRAQAVTDCLEKGYVDIIKGNLGEVMAVAGWHGGKSRGVDSIDAGNLDDRCRLAVFLARRERNIVLVTGKDDVVSDGLNTIIVSNGHPLLGKITGSGCSLGSVLGGCLAVERSNKLLAAVTAVLWYTIASEIAASNPLVSGPGTFLSAFVDEMHRLSTGDYEWISKGQLSLWKG